MNPTAETPRTLMAWSLPIFLTKANKYAVGAAFGLFAAALYLASNHLYIFPPQLLPMSWVDFHVPFMPHTVWIYTSEYIFFGAVYLTCKDLVNVNKYLYSFLALQVVSVLIFWLWPTTYPRDNYPLPADLDTLTFYVFNTLRSADTPANCCPSLHVSSVFLSSFIFLDEQKGKFPFFFGWAAAIAISTLTTKQHYLIDVATGFLMAAVFYWMFHRFVSYRPLRGRA